MRSNKKEEQEENSSTFNGLLVGGMRRADENKRSRTYRSTELRTENKNFYTKQQKMSDSFQVSRRRLLLLHKPIE